jgi:hypothetical protein
MRLGKKVFDRSDLFYSSFPDIVLGFPDELHLFRIAHYLMVSTNVSIHRAEPFLSEYALFPGKYHQGSF